MVETRALTPGGSPVVRWALILIAVLPFQLGLWHHLTVGGAEATGFLGYDAPYYAANGRETFERGNGFSHPNPYDPDPAAPAIYFHWLTWWFGFGIKVLHCDPGVFYVATGLVAALLGSWLTWRLVGAVLPDPRGRNLLFLLTMWGGGALCLGAVGYSLGTGRPAWEDLFIIDYPAGWWFANWGRNFVLPTESVYHVLAALIWLGVLRGRWGLALGGAAALAATHPFSGAQHLAILGAWTGYLALRDRTAPALGRAALVGLMLALFAAYYFWFLNLFPTHRQLQAGWANAWNTSLPFLLLSTGPVAALAAWRLKARQWRLDDRERFLLVAGCVTIGLMKHDWFISPHQPIHFGRGYNWLPFWLIALPQIQAAAAALAASARRWWARGLLVVAGALCVFDNAAFLGRTWTDGEQGNHLLEPALREMFAWMDAARLDGVLLCADARVSYLSATYTGVRPYIGHLANTPDVRLRWREITGWHRRGETWAGFDRIDYILIRPTDKPAVPAGESWRELHRNDGFILLGRAR